ncbi:MoxR family ATPase [Methylobacillus sp.]|uniref:AAA family ATPase n=1 Tax=Methylobacillus sp. TaxID=56818 RepID=UPI0012BFDFED|nr:MoxR family ATPase [Methylobacillus sp.]MPS48469.1 porphyrin biosynthesis protein [Methylobacillus sp.]
MTNAAVEVQGEEPIQCKICGDKVHHIEMHLKKAHIGMTLGEYETKYPGAPTLSGRALRLVREHAEKTAKGQGSTEVASNVTPINPSSGAVVGLTSNVTMSTVRREMSKAFNIDPKTPGCISGRGTQVEITCIDGPRHELVPEINENYVYEMDVLRNVLMAVELNIPLMLWGHTGTGKTTLLNQVFARTNRPALRVQHTLNMEERDVVGQMMAGEGRTFFQLGPLPMAMKNGWAYIADEYDFANPAVLALYQPVLEGEPLVIKEADEGNRIIRPHPQFRFLATGNTNGTGDETFLYAGTQTQNSANYDRFGIVIKKNYMAQDQEIAMIVKKTGIQEKDAARIVDFATRIRQQYEAGEMRAPISPRTLLNIAMVGMTKANYQQGIELSFSSKLSSSDKAAADDLAQRIFGSH